MRIGNLSVVILIASAAATLDGQPIPVPGTQPPVTGPAYWSSAPPDCSSLAGESPAAIGTVGYACYVSGTFVFL